MIKNNGCCDLEYAKKLKELGVKQDSLWYWAVRENGKATLIPKEDVARFEGLAQNGKVYSAFTVAELGEILPADEEYRPAYYTKRHSDGTWWVYSYDCDEGGCEEVGRGIYADTEANARAKMLIYLLEYKLIEVKK